jgi:hypothetical protein
MLAPPFLVGLLLAWLKMRWWLAWLLTCVILPAMIYIGYLWQHKSAQDLQTSLLAGLAFSAIAGGCGVILGKFIRAKTKKDKGGEPDLQSV